MSYSIIFETKIVKLPDGRIIHFDRSGCNNDTEGRKKDEFHGKIYTELEFIEMANRFKQNSKPYKASDPQFWELKIGSRYGTYYDYGEHLLRMLKRALPYEDFIKQYGFSARYCKSIELLEPERREMTVEEFDRLYYELNRKGSLSWRCNMEYPKELTTIIDCMEQGKELLFCIMKHGRKRLLR